MTDSLSAWSVKFAGAEARAAAMPRPFGRWLARVIPPPPAPRPPTGEPRPEAPVAPASRPSRPSMIEKAMAAGLSAAPAGETADAPIPASPAGPMREIGEWRAAAADLSRRLVDSERRTEAGLASLADAIDRLNARLDALEEAAPRGRKRAPRRLPAWLRSRLAALLPGGRR